MLDLLHQIPTAFLFFSSAFILLFLPQGLARNFVLLGTPIIAAIQIWTLGMGDFSQISFFGFELELMRLDSLSRIFVLIFCLAAFLGNLFAWHLRDTIQQVSALAYAGSAIGAALSGDMIALFFYWEGTAIASVFLIWARRTEGSYWTGMRYLIIQIMSGVILITGVALYYYDTGSITFELMELGSIATWLIFISFGMKCAFPLLHNWLQDSYPAATITGTVILSAFTTKLAVYALARGFAGTEILIYIGTVMALFPIFFAEIENDLRRVLAYSLNNQLGFMVVGVGIGTELALNGTASHAFAHILYKALLFMSVGAVMYRTGTSKASELGGLSHDRCCGNPPGLIAFQSSVCPLQCGLKMTIGLNVMRMTNGNRKRICGVRPCQLYARQLQHHHMFHLLFIRVPNTHHSLFYSIRCIFPHLKPELSRHQHRNAARLAQLQCPRAIPVHKGLLNSGMARLILHDHGTEPVK